MKPTNIHRKLTHRRGLIAEYFCIFSLWCRGYRIVAHRWKHPAGEIDIIVERFGTLAFVEVKARPSIQAGMEAVIASARQRIARAAGAFIASHSEYAGHRARFDLMVCVSWRLPGHLPDAWRM